MTDTYEAPVLRTAEAGRFSRMLGIGGYRSDRVVPNSEIVGPINSSDEWIRQRTGIVTRRRASADIGVPEMAVAASRSALENAGLQPEQIDAVILATVSFPYATPSAASLVAERIGAGTVPAWDISAACAGYCYGLAQADALVRAGMNEHVLVIGVEKLSELIDPTDRSISFLLGDGAGAAVVGPSDTPGIGKTVWGSKGENWDTIKMTHSLLEMRDHPELGMPTLRQEGPTVFRWAVWEMAKVAKQALAEAGIEASDLSAFIPHQANIRIIDELAKQLKLPESVAIGRDIVETGNTSAASIPLAAERLLREQPELHGRLALQIGFGAGLVFAAQIVVLP